MREGDRRGDEKGAKKGEKTKKKQHKMEEVPSGRRCSKVSLRCRPVVSSTFSLNYMITKQVELIKE